MAIFKDKSNKIIFGNGLSIKTECGGNVKLIGIDFTLGQPIIGIYYPNDSNFEGKPSAETWAMNGLYHGPYSSAMNLRSSELKTALRRIGLRVPKLEFDPDRPSECHRLSWMLKPFDMFDEYVVTSSRGNAYHLICYDTSLSRPWVAIDMSIRGEDVGGILTFNSDGTCRYDDEVIEGLAELVPSGVWDPDDDDEQQPFTGLNVVK